MNKFPIPARRSLAVKPRFGGSVIAGPVLMQVAIKARCHPRQYIAKPLPGVSLRCVRHAHEHRSEAAVWRALRSARFLHISARPSG
jgi:hypothetical protein